MNRDKLIFNTIGSQIKVILGSLKPEVKCEVCGYGLNRTEKYGRNLCESCEEKLND